MLLSRSHLTSTVNAWTLLAVAASRQLAGLYRALGDGKQAFNAIQAGVPSEERAQRLGLTGRLPNEGVLFGKSDSEVLENEREAWQTLIEAQAGLCAFHGMVADHERARELQGSRNVSNKAFQAALKGYRIAFPEPMASIDIAEAILAAADGCVAAFVKDLEESGESSDFSETAQHVHRSILEALRAEAGLPIIE